MKPRVISFHYKLTNSRGDTLDSSFGQEPLSFLEGANQIIPGLESELVKLKVGEKSHITVAAEDAYGQRDESLIVEIERHRLPPGQINVGDRFRSSQHPTPLTVTKVTDTHITLDANHPLAGQDLTFDVEITGIRNATDEEIAHGHVH